MFDYKGKVREDEREAESNVDELAATLCRIYDDFYTFQRSQACFL